MSQAPINGVDIIGDGASEVAIGINGGKVVLRFPKALEWVALDPENARQIAEAIARCAYEAHYGRPAQTAKSQLSNQKHVALIRRVTLMLGSFQRESSLPSNNKMATAIVDSILSEVL